MKAGATASHYRILGQIGGGGMGVVYKAGGKWQTSTEGGTEAVWNPNGRELFYGSGNRAMAVSISTENGFATVNRRCSSRETT